MDPVRAYRDDGPLTTMLARGLAPLRRHALALGLLGAVAIGLATAFIDESSDVLPVFAAAVFVLLAAPGAGPGAGSMPGRLAWLLPPLIRLGEYGFVLGLAVHGGSQTLPAVYGLLAAVAFHHYDIVYRLRHQRVQPPRWITSLGGGWDGRMLLVGLFFAGGVLANGATVLAAWCGALFVLESIASWMRFNHLRSPAVSPSRRVP